MKSQRGTPRVSLKNCFLAACVATMLCLSHAAFAQSGRRSKSAPSPPTPVAEPQAEPTASPSNAKPVARTSIIVGKDRFGSTNFVLSSYADVAVRACIDRINESKGLEATGGGDMTRKDAIDRAKKQTNGYVLWIEIRDEQGADDNISIGYSVYMPETAKILTSGRVYLGTRGAGAGGVIVGVPSASRRLPLEYQMREAGHEVADRIMDKLHPGLPD